MLSLSPNDVVAMPLDALALRILDDVIDSEEWNWRNWMVKQQQTEAFAHRADALRALEEAWAWLRSKALVAHEPTQSSEGAIFVTRSGRHAIKDGLALTRAQGRLEVDPHPRIASAIRSQFLLGEYGLAALAAFRDVEVRVRELGGLTNEDFGVKLMHRAFGERGRLRDTTVPKAEADAMRELFTGAYGSFRNPQSHRMVDLDDVTMASEVVLLADLLLRILDRIEGRLA